jgi:hypothetical protein
LHVIEKENDSIFTIFGNQISILFKRLAARNFDNFVVEIPEVDPKNEKWAYILDSELHVVGGLYNERKASCQMRDTNEALHMIAYFCSILNTDPAYIDPFFCWEEGFEVSQRTANLMDDPNEVLYYEFRTVFGVVIAYIAGYLMHCHIEITLNMYDVDGRPEFKNVGKFTRWSAERAQFEETDGANDTNYDPDVMKYITPFNDGRRRGANEVGPSAKIDVAVARPEVRCTQHRYLHCAKEAIRAERQREHIIMQSDGAKQRPAQSDTL